MAVPYDFAAIEDHWRRRWEDAGLHRADLDASEPPLFYNLVEFPYPSADGLHVGHVFKYAGADAYGRYQRMRGRRVFQPIGFDAFGIHSENFALRTGEHPARLTRRTIASFRRQLSGMGMAWDWSRVVDTSDPDYYRWTQWVLTRLFRAGLMYQADAPVLWCPSCLTVLAREQTETVDGREHCERCSAEVAERNMRQWFLRITAYADRLLEGLDALDWPQRAKTLQRQWIGRRRTEDGPSYRLHDWLISRQRYWGPPIPIVHCPDCGAVPVPDDQLPVRLPEVEEFRPTGTGFSPLAAIEDFVATTCPSCGAAARRETDVSDTFVDSSWYFLRYPSTEFSDRPWDEARTRSSLPVDFYAGGSEHVARHHLYARFMTVALHDLGLVPFEEPFTRLRLGGLIVKDGAKMSKSRGNVVSPDDYAEAHGADVLRCALLFAAPWEAGGDFRDSSIAGIERFFARLWQVALDEPVADTDADADEERLVERTIVAVTSAFEKLTFNVALSRLMELSASARSARAKTVLVQLLAPLAPHLAEELWHRLGRDFSVHTSAWPVADASLATGEAADIVVQVDGRTRVRLRLPPGSSEDDVTAAAVAALGDVEAVRVVHVPGRLVNLVTRRR